MHSFSRKPAKTVHAIM